MKLFEESVSFKTYEMLESMVELSKRRRPLSAKTQLDEYAVSFSFGRGAGHTQSIIKYISANLKEKFLVFVKNDAQRNEYLKYLPNTNNFKIISPTGPNSFNQLIGVDETEFIVILDSCRNINDLTRSVLSRSPKAFISVGA